MKLDVIRGYLNGLTIQELRTSGKRLKVKGLSKCKKEDIVTKILQHYAIPQIQRWTRKCIGSNDVCPFSMEPIKYPCWGKKTNHGFFYSNLFDLISYFVTTGDFREPNTRIPYTESELDKIESLGKCYKYKFPKTLKIARSNKKYYKQQKDFNEQIDILTERIRFTTWVIRDKLEDIVLGRENVGHVNIHLENIYFPDMDNCIFILSTKCTKSLKISLESSKKIMDDFEIDCDVTNRIRDRFYDWLNFKMKEYRLAK